MKKNLLFILGMLIAFPSFARDIEYPYEGQTLTYTVIDENAKTVKTKEGDLWAETDQAGNEVSGDLVIPSQISDGDKIYDVIEIGQYAFCNCSGLTSISIPESVKNSRRGAFWGCNGLNYAEFASIEALCGIEFGSDRANPLFHAHKLYIDGKEVTSITIPESVKEIKNYTFCGCNGFTSVTIPNSVTSIGVWAFYNCSGLTSIIIPEFVKEIKDFTFYCCNSLTYVTIPNSVTSIGSHAFGECSNLTSVSFPNSVTSIGEYAFRGCSSLTSVAIINSITKIDDLAFWECKNLSSVVLRASSIGNGAFQDCENLTSVILLATGSNIKVDAGAFWWNSKFLKCAYPNTISNPFASNIYATPYEWDKAAYISNNTIIYGEDYKSVLFVGYNEDGDYSIPSSVTEIGAHAYSYLPNLKTIEIPNDVTTIGNQAFAKCEALENVILPMKLETLGSAVFENSSSIKNVVFNGPTPVESASDVFDSKVYEDATLYVRSGRQTLFMAVSPWKFFYNITDAAYSGVEDVIADFNEDAPCEVFNLNGVKVGESTDNLPSGIYIVRQGNNVKKIAVK